MKNAIHENKIYTLNVYNYGSGCLETVEVTEEVYRTYQRTGWSIENNDTSFYAHEIQFSSLIGGDENAFQGFREFIDTENTPEQVHERKEMVEVVRRAIHSLSYEEQELILARYFEGVSLRQFAQIKGVSHTVIHRRELNILKKLKKYWEF